VRQFEWKLGPMLSYDQPIVQAKPDDRQAPPRSPKGFSVLELTWLLWRHRLAIAMAALICACAAIAIGKSLTPKYSATAQLYVDPRELQLVDRELTPRSQDLSGLAMVVESQARLITSNSVLLRAIQDTHLDKDPEFGGESGGMLASLLGLFGLDIRSATEAKPGETAALEILGRHVNVKKTDRSFIVDVEVWSHDPAKAAMLANAISSAYLAESTKSQATAARRATTDLSGRLKELQQRLRNSENALATYKAQNNFVGSQDTAISDQQLSSSNQRLAAAHALTLDAQARYDQIESSRRAATDAGAIPEALQSPTIANLRAQYAEARKRYAELASELGPLHPSLRQMEKQVDDLRRTVNEEVERFAQSARNDLTRARDYETSLGKALDAQKRQSVQLSQASVRLRELERDVGANRDVYQSFLKRSRETEEQETLNTSSARIIGEATVPQRRSFPPAMSVIAMIGLTLGALAASAWVVAADRLSPDTSGPQPMNSDNKTRVPSKPAPAGRSRPQPVVAAVEKPLLARLQESDVMRTLGGILKTGGIPDLTRAGWPTLRAGFPLTSFLDAMREMRATVARRSPGNTMPVIAVIGAGASEDRSIAALNVALAAARDGARVMMIDADPAAHGLSDRVSGLGNSEPGRLGWLSIGSKASRAIKTANGIAILPAIKETDGKASDAIRKAIAQARSAGGYDLVILDGPAMPWAAPDRKLIDLADGLIAILPVNLDINDCMEDIIAALGDAGRKLVGVVLNELNPAAVNRQRGRQYA
jgi:polysaccharide biosynthesis transport protein